MDRSQPAAQTLDRSQPSAQTMDRSQSVVRITGIFIVYCSSQNHNKGWQICRNKVKECRVSCSSVSYSSVSCSSFFAVVFTVVVIPAVVLPAVMLPGNSVAYNFEVFSGVFCGTSVLIVKLRSSSRSSTGPFLVHFSSSLSLFKVQVNSWFISALV